jgi:hypothetical protein
MRRQKRKINIVLAGLLCSAALLAPTAQAEVALFNNFDPGAVRITMTPAAVAELSPFTLLLAGSLIGASFLECRRNRR